MSFINWGHETPEQKEIRRRMEERMLFEQMAYNAGMAAAAAAGSGGIRKNYVVSGRSSMSSFSEDGEYKYYTYNYETDTLNKIYSTGLNENDYSDSISVLQDKGFILRYRNGSLRTFIFTDINGIKIKEISFNGDDYLTDGRNYDSGLTYMVYRVTTDNELLLNIFDGTGIKDYTISDIYIYPWGSPDYDWWTTANGTIFLKWRSADGTKYYVGILENGGVTVLDSIISGSEYLFVDVDWTADFAIIFKSDYNTNIYTSFKIIGPDGAVLKSQDVTTLGHNSLRQGSFYGNNKYFFILSGNINDEDEVFAYDYDSNTLVQSNITDTGEYCNAYYHYHDAYYPNGMSNDYDNGILGVNTSNNLLITYHDYSDAWEDGHGTYWYNTGVFGTYTLFDGDTQFGYYDAHASGLTAFHFDQTNIIRGFAEDQTIILDGFQWDAGAGRGSEQYKRLVIKPNNTYNIVSTVIPADTHKLHDNFFLGSKIIYLYYVPADNNWEWLAFDSNGMTNSDSISVGTNMEYYRTHDTLAIIDFTNENTWIVNQYSDHHFGLLDSTGVWYNQIFLSDNNGYGDISPTTEYAFYPNNTGWGSLVLVHDLGIEDADYGKAIIIQQNAQFGFTLPMVYGNSWYGELGHNTFLFAWHNNIGGWSANLYDLEGNILSGSNLSEDDLVTGDISLWNLNDRAIVSIIPNTANGDYYHYYFGQSAVSSVNVGLNDYWWENDFPAWYY